MPKKTTRPLLTSRKPITRPVPCSSAFDWAGESRAANTPHSACRWGRAWPRTTQLAFSGRASQPMRVSVQARHPGTGARWRRSVYLDATPRDITVAFEEMIPVAASGTFDPAATDTILFVVDTMNTAARHERNIHDQQSTG